MQKLVLILFCVFITTKIYSQNIDAEIIQSEFKTSNEGFSDAWKCVKNGNKLFDEGNTSLYSDAINFYLEAYKYNSKNAQLNYRIGVCKLFSDNKESSLEYLLSSYNLNPKCSGYLPYYLAKSEMLNLKFDDAKKHLDEFYKNKSELAKIGATNVRKLKEQCDACQKLVDNPVDVTIENIAEVNSAWPDYGPVITADESIMLFTSRREGTTGNNIDKSDNLPYEDIYISYMKNGKWQTPQNAGTKLNTENHDATVAISADGLSLLTYTQGDLYISNLENGEWTVPEKLPANINSTMIENSACFSYDGKCIYFIRGRNPDPEKSNGDIYFSRKTATGWGKAVKLPPNINTKYDEDGVFMLPDGKTLIFSSKGHNSMGGYDIFKTTMIGENVWSDPINLGYPINTPNDNVYFVMSADGKTGYYSAARNDSKGYTDIYKVTFNQRPEKQQEKDTITEQKTIASNMTLVTGTITDKKTNSPVEAQLEIFDLLHNQLIYSTHTNSVTSKYLVSLPSGQNYGMAVKADGYLYYSENFNLISDSTFTKKVIDIKLQKIEQGSKTVLNNLFFDTDKWDIKPESESELTEIAQMLKNKPELKLEISGHTDSNGSKEHNKTLSEKRANSVVEWLVNKGIDKNRLTFIGAGDTQPIADNSTEEGRKQNRRVEIEVKEQ